MIVDLDETEIQLIIGSLNHYMSSDLYIEEERDREIRDNIIMNKAQIRLYEAVQRHKKR